MLMAVQDVLDTRDILSFAFADGSHIAPMSKISSGVFKKIPILLKVEMNLIISCIFRNFEINLFFSAVFQNCSYILIRASMLFFALLLLFHCHTLLLLISAIEYKGEPRLAFVYILRFSKFVYSLLSLNLSRMGIFPRILVFHSNLF
ncbi:hypothetical protein AQUCO_00900265v1 [Aquilegia coerulea]|uniref:Uncharacterized protein n=1 Tax=Aquilegia coerulea TaxID=218851 RepID=A0A2G5ECW6_AQUCA|nr:hypothetical protein AQUCO_00900265v1 [Aquilegia coerulea]